MVVLVVDLMQKGGRVDAMLREKPIWLRWGFYYFLLLSILLLGNLQAQQFIYSQF